MKYPTLIVNPPPDFATDAYLEANLKPADVVIVKNDEQDIHLRRAANRECTAFVICLGPSYTNTTDKALKDGIVNRIDNKFGFVTFSEQDQRYVGLNYLDHNPNNSRRRSRQVVQQKLQNTATHPGVQVLSTLPQLNRLFEKVVSRDAVSISRSIIFVLDGIYSIVNPPPADLKAFILKHQNDRRVVILLGQHRTVSLIVKTNVENSTGNLAINRVAQLVGPIWWGGNKALRKTIVDYFQNVWTFMVWYPRSGTFVPYASMPLKENRTIDDHVKDRIRYLLTKQGAGRNKHPHATIENIDGILDAAVARFVPANLDGLGEDQNFDDDATLPFNDETENQLAAREEGRGRGRGAAPANRRRESGRSSSNERHQTFDSDSDGNLSPEGSDTDDSFPGSAPPASDSESETVSGLLDDSSDENSIRSRKKHLRRVGDYRSTANASNVSSYDDEFDVSTNEDGDVGGDGNDNENVAVRCINSVFMEMPSTETPTTPPKEFWKPSYRTLDEFMKAKYPNNSRQIIALGRGRNDKIINASAVLREYEGVAKALSFSYRLNMDTQNEDVNKLLVKVVTARYPNPVTYSKKHRTLIPWTGRYANKVEKKLASEAKEISEQEHKLETPSNVKAISQSLSQVALFNGGVEAIANHTLHLINSIVLGENGNDDDGPPLRRVDETEDPIDSIVPDVVNLVDSSDENSTRSRKDSSDEDGANENESTASTPDGDDFDTILDFDLYPCVECGRQFRGDFPDESATRLADLQRDGEGLCRDCWDNVLSGASGNDSDDDTLSDDDVSYLVIDDGDDSDSNDNDSNETNDDGDGLEDFDDENSANRNDVQLVVPAHEHGVAAGSAGGQSGDGTPSSSAEAEGRQDYAAPALVTTSAFDKGQSVWVTQGRTPHLAVYLGDVSSHDGYELVQWKSDNTQDFVYPASISAVDFGSSRRRRRRAPPSDIYIDNEKTKDPPGESLDEDDDDNNHDNKRTTGKSENSLGGDGDDNNNHSNNSTTERSEDAYGGNDGGNESKTDNAVMVSDVESSDDHDNGDDGLATAEEGTGGQQTESENSGQVDQKSPNDEDERNEYRKALRIRMTAWILAKQSVEGGTDSENNGQVEQKSSNDEDEHNEYRKGLRSRIIAWTLAGQSN